MDAMGLDGDHPGPDRHIAQDQEFRALAIQFQDIAFGQFRRGNDERGMLLRRAINGDRLAHDSVLDCQTVRHFVSSRGGLDVADIRTVSLEANNGTGLADGFCGDDGGDALTASHDYHLIADTNLRPQDVNESLLIVCEVLKKMRE